MQRLARPLTKGQRGSSSAWVEDPTQATRMARHQHSAGHVPGGQMQSQICQALEEKERTPGEQQPTTGQDGERRGKNSHHQNGNGQTAAEGASGDGDRNVRSNSQPAPSPPQLERAPVQVAQEPPATCVQELVDDCRGGRDRQGAENSAGLLRDFGKCAPEPAKLKQLEEQSAQERQAQSGRQKICGPGNHQALLPVTLAQRSRVSSRFRRYRPSCGPAAGERCSHFGNRNATLNRKPQSGPPRVPAA